MSSKRIKSNNSRQSAYITMKSSWSSKFLTPINDKAREIDDKFSEWQRLGTHRILYCIFDLQCIGAIPSQYIRNIFFMVYHRMGSLERLDRINIKTCIFTTQSIV